MPAANTKSAPASGTVPKAKNAKAPSSSNSTSAVPETAQDAPEASSVSAGGSGKPDKAAYDAEQDSIRKDIDALQVELSAVRQKIALATKSGSGNDRRTTLRAELDGIRGQQSNNKASRSKIFDQLKSIQDGIQKKVKDLQAAKSKIPFKTVAEVDAHIKTLEKQVESGNMKVADEKRALQEISQTKRSRRTVESFQAEQETIEAERRTAEELRKQLDDPESKAASERYDAIKAELDELKKESDEAYAGRSKLFEERDALQAQLNILYNKKRESSQTFRDTNDRYWNKVNEDRARRAEKARAQRAADEAQKKLEIAEHLREEASAPAFQAQIEDCQTLIDYFTGKNSGNVTYVSSPPSSGLDVVGMSKLELRKVDAASDEGLVARKKKGEDEEAYFVGGKGKGKGKKGSAKATSDTNGIATSSTQLNVPLPTLSALLSLSIPPPVSSTDVPRVVQDLQTKKAWFEANQARVTSENISKAEADIMRLTNGKANDKANEIASTAAEVRPPNGGGERPAEPASTPHASGSPATAVPSGEVAEKLDGVKEGEEQD